VVGKAASFGGDLNAKMCGGFLVLGGGPSPRLDTVDVSYVSSERLAHARLARSELVDRIERSTAPTVAPERCDGFEDSASNGDGALHVWCRKVLEAAVGIGGGKGSKPPSGALGLSYGIFTWDSWSRHLSNNFKVPTVLYDCYATAATLGDTPALEGYKAPSRREEICLSGSERTEGGKKFQSLGQHLAPRGTRGTLVKIDIEGSEWSALRGLTDEELGKMDLLDLQIYLCHALPPDPVERRAKLLQRVALLERLVALFGVTARAPQSRRYRGRTDDELCGSKRSSYPDVISISYVNLARLADAR